MKLIVTGLGRHGKDTMCEYLRDHENMKFCSSSQVAAKVVYLILKDKYGYSSEEECFLRRHEVRKEWFDIIRDYNKEDEARLGKEILKDNDVYCGLRSKEELGEIRRQGLVDFVIWVDSSERVGTHTEDESSITIRPVDCDHIVRNNGTLEEFHRDIKFLVDALKSIQIFRVNTQTH